MEIYEPYEELKSLETEQESSRIEQESIEVSNWDE